MNLFAFLFDIDGVLTLPITEERKISIIDPTLMNFLESLHTKELNLPLLPVELYLGSENF